MQQYQAVTDRIIAMLESGVRPWARSWKTGVAAPHQPSLVRPLRVGGQPYRGVNVINLWACGQAHGYASPYWLTFKAGKLLGAYVRKGEHAEMAFFVGRHTRTRTNDAGEDIEDSFSFLRCYSVFNADQFADLPPRFHQAPKMPVLAEPVRDAACEAFVRNTGVNLRVGGDKAFYMPSHDMVAMPHIAAFDCPQSYYATLLHEMTHWTSAEQRCNRQLGARFGDEAYAAEELIAELGAAFLCADLRISAEPREDHASYLAHWIKVMRADNRAIFRASALAEKAAGYLHSLQPGAVASNDPGEGEQSIAA